MTIWTRLPIALLGALLVGAPASRGAPPDEPGAPAPTTAASPASRTVSQQQPADLPGVIFGADEERRAVLLEDADLFAAASTNSELVMRLPAGTVLEYAGESVDGFARTWSTLRNPSRIRARRDSYLAPFDYAEFEALGGTAALLADRLVSVAPVAAPGAPAIAPPPPATDPSGQPWWKPRAVLTLGQAPTYGEVVAMSARRVSESDVSEAISLLGGLEAIASWPDAALPGELFIPEMLPVLFQYDGAAWTVARPVRFFGAALSLIGNPLLRVDSAAPPLAGGPPISCWTLVGALDPRGAASGSVRVAPPVAVPRGRTPPTPETTVGLLDPDLASPQIRSLLPPAPLTALLPPRVDPVTAPSGVEIRDDDGRQAVYLEQSLGAATTQRLRGRELVLDVWARAAGPPGTPATFGIDVEVGPGPEGVAQHFANGFAVGSTLVRVEVPVLVADTSEAITVRLLPLERTLAVAQRGSVVIERVALRLPHWHPLPAASFLTLHRLTAMTFEGEPLHTRAPVAVTTRGSGQIGRIWPRVAGSDWSIEDRRLVLAGRVRHGMTQEQVRASWGAPRDEGAPGGETGVDRRWTYDDRFAVFSANELIAFQVARAVAAPAPRLVCPGSADAGAAAR